MNRGVQFLVFIVSFGCATTSLDESIRRVQGLPPPTPDLQYINQRDREQYLTEYGLKNASIEAQWWSKYQLGLLWSQGERTKACTAFTELATQHEFPLRNLAELRRFSVCETDETYSFEQYTRLTERRPWLQDLALEAALKSAERQKNPSELISVLWEKSRRAKLKTERESFLLRAFDHAREINDETAIADIEKQILQIAPRLRPEDTPPLAVANDFRNVREYAKAQQYYEKHLAEATSVEDRITGLNGLRINARLASRKAEAVRYNYQIKILTEKQWKTNPSPTAARIYLDSVTQWARAVWTEGNDQLARKSLIVAEKKLRGHTPLEDLYWLLGRISDENRDYEKAIEYYQMALKSPIASTASDKVRWNLAWQNYKSGHYEQALKYFKELSESKKSSEFDLSKYQYWYGRTQQMLKQPADDTFLALAKTDSLGYYGLLAQHHLKSELTPNAPRSHSWINNSIFNNNIERAYLEWLLAAGEQPVAQVFLNTRAEELKSSGKTDDDEWIELLHYYARSGKYLDLFRQINSIQPPEKREALVAGNRELYFPRPYEEIVKKEAVATLVPAELMYSIMRQESAFDPSARSGADALGLMQILPSIAAQYLEAGNFNAEDLYDPKTNIRAGGRLLRALLKRFNNNFILSVAAYNASPEAVNVWLKTRHREDPIEFIEEIPYEETKGYVKLVLRNFAQYSRGSSRGIIPAWCLQSFQPSPQ